MLCVCIILSSSILFYHYYSFVIVLNSFYSLGNRLCTTCSKENKECLVIDCKDFRKSPHPKCLYCKHHSDPNTTRCAKCKTQGLADGSDTQYCPTCNLLCRKGMGHFVCTRDFSYRMFCIFKAQQIQY